MHLVNLNLTSGKSYAVGSAASMSTYLQIYLFFLDLFIYCCMLNSICLSLDLKVIHINNSGRSSDKSCTSFVQTGSNLSQQMRGILFLTPIRCKVRFVLRVLQKKKLKKIHLKQHPGFHLSVAEAY